MLLKGQLEFIQERLKLPGDFKKKCRGIVTVSFGLERLRRRFFWARKRRKATKEKKEDIIRFLF